MGARYWSTDHLLDRVVDRVGVMQAETVYIYHVLDPGTGQKHIIVDYKAKEKARDKDGKHAESSLLHDAVKKELLDENDIE